MRLSGVMDLGLWRAGVVLQRWMDGGSSRVGWRFGAGLEGKINAAAAATRQARV
jgi:hypothetical protein